MYLFICRTHWFLFPMVLLQHVCTTEIKEWVPSYELTRTNFIKKKNHPICNFKIMELIIDMTVDSTVNNKHFVLGTLYENENP